MVCDGIKIQEVIDHKTGAKTQTTINRLSKSAEGMAKSEARTSPTTVFPSMKGEVVAQHGTAVLSHSVVAAPGARAELSGTYSLVAKTIDLRGLLRTTGKLSDTTSGFRYSSVEGNRPALETEEQIDEPGSVYSFRQSAGSDLLARNQKKTLIDRHSRGSFMRS